MPWKTTTPMEEAIRFAVLAQSDRFTRQAKGVRPRNAKSRLAGWVELKDAWKMARKLRIEFEGAIYHVLNRGNYRRDLFTKAGEAQAFIGALREAGSQRGQVR